MRGAWFLRVAWAATLLTPGCGGAASEPRQVRSGAHEWLVPREPANPLVGTTAVGPDLDGTCWELVETRCPESRFRPSERRMSQVARVAAHSAGFFLSYDRTVADCSETIVQQAIAAATTEAEWLFKEEAHVSLPPDCGQAVELDRPGNMRRRGEKLEVFAQRSWMCGGFDAQLVYAPRAPAPLTDEEVVRHYVAHMNRRDVNAIADLFAETASFVEPFTLDESGAPVRHEGRVAIRAWYESALGGLPWAAMRVLAVERSSSTAQLVVQWEYMDPRMTEPIVGRNTFTIAGGEILESRLELVSQPAEPNSGVAGPQSGP